MEIVTYIMLAFAVVGAVDRIIGNKLGLGAEFEKGAHLLGAMFLSMTGMLVLSPVISSLLSGIGNVFPSFLDFSIIPSIFIANDLGAVAIAKGLAKSQEIALFNGLVVASTIGATISFSLPYAMERADKKHHKNILFGFLCGIVTVPLSVFVGGLVSGIEIVTLLLDIVPLVIICAILAFCLVKFEKATVKVFKVFGLIIKAVITVGLVIGIIQFLTESTIIEGTEDFIVANEVILNAACFMAGAFPLLFVLKKLLVKPLGALGKKMGINPTSSVGFLASSASFVLQCDNYDEMDEKGVVLNSAFAVSGAFAFVGHLAFTMAVEPSYLPAVLVTKLLGGVLAVALAYFLYKNREKKEKQNENNCPQSRS